MGIITNHAALLMKAKKKGVNFEKTLTLGHQTLYLPREDLAKLVKAHLDNSRKISLDQFTYGDYADQFLKDFIGAKTVDSLDVSDYQGAKIIHDMNFPIGEEYNELYDVVIEGGTIEHIFNFPVAIENCMKMTKVGGSLFVFTTCNNHTGHGFYQFSPEVFYRIFSEEAGWKVEEMVLEMHPYPGSELSRGRQLYAVKDPNDVKERVGLVTNSPVLILAHAVKLESKEVFSSFPIQSDYSAIHGQHEKESAPQDLITSRAYLIRKIFNSLPQNVRRHLSGIRQRRRYRFSNKKYYAKWKPFS